MIHPHDTDRILAVLGEAIDEIRGIETVIRPLFPVCADGLAERANDLALLHGAVSAERDAHVSEWVLRAKGLSEGAKPKDIDVKRSKAGRLRYLHREEIEQETALGEHDDEERGIR